MAPLIHDLFALNSCIVSHTNSADNFVGNSVRAENPAADFMSSSTWLLEARFAHRKVINIVVINLISSIVLKLLNLTCFDLATLGSYFTVVFMSTRLPTL